MNSKQKVFRDDQLEAQIARGPVSHEDLKGKGPEESGLNTPSPDKSQLSQHQGDESPVSEESSSGSADELSPALIKKIVSAPRGGSLDV